MPQDRESGARARDFGYHMARRVGQTLGATLTNPGRSNEAVWGTRRILIKSARCGVPKIGATEATLARVDAIVAVLQDPDGDFTLYQVTTEWFRGEMEPSRSPRASHVMMVGSQSVRSSGTVIGHIHPGS